MSLVKPSKKVAIVQSNYIPWKGYFDLIAAADVFILYDDVQYTRRDWRNRNLIKTPNGLQWLTVPVKVKGKYSQSVKETIIDGTTWQQKHWDTISSFYRRSDFFDEACSLIKPLYINREYTTLSELNKIFIVTFCNYLGIKTQINDSSDYILSGDKSERLLNLCIAENASHYISGPAARSYLDCDLFASHDISVEWFDYFGYPEYKQLWGDFAHNVSIIDLIFNCGAASPNYLKYISL